MFNKNMPQSIFIRLGAIAARCGSLRYILSHYELEKLGWERLERISIINSRLTGSGEGVRTIVYRVHPTIVHEAAEKNHKGVVCRDIILTKSESSTEEQIESNCLQMGNFIARLANFESNSLQAVLQHWEQNYHEIDITGSKFVEISDGVRVRRTQRKGRESIVCVLQSLFHDLKIRAGHMHLLTCPPPPLLPHTCIQTHTHARATREK